MFQMYRHWFIERSVLSFQLSKMCSFSGNTLDKVFIVRKTKCHYLDFRHWVYGCLQLQDNQQVSQFQSNRKKKQGWNTSKLTELCICVSFSLADCNLTRHSCEIVVSALQSLNSSLRDLDLSNNDLQDTGVKMLSDALKSTNCKLEILRCVRVELQNNK